MTRVLICSTNKHILAQMSTATRLTKTEGESEMIRFRVKGDFKKRLNKLSKIKGVRPSHILRQATLEYLEKMEAVA